MFKPVFLAISVAPAVVLALLSSGRLVHFANAHTVERSGCTQEYTAAPGMDFTLREVAGAWRRGEYTAARSAARRLTDPVLRAEIEQIIIFGEARLALTQNDFTAATAAARSLVPGPKRALLLVALANTLQAPAAERMNMLETALRDAGALTERPRRAILELLLPVILEVNQQRGLEVLDRLLHEKVRVITGPQQHSGQVTYVAAQTRLIEIVPAPGSVSRQFFVLAIPGLKSGNVGDLLVANHASLRCTHRKT